MKKFAFINILFFLVISFAHAQAVSDDISMLVAKNFFYEKLNLKQKVNYDDLELLCKDNIKIDGQIVIRVYEPLNRPGFILLSSNLQTVPVLAWSLEGSYEVEKNLPPNLNNWLNAYAEQINRAYHQKGERNQLWNYYSLKHFIPKKDASKGVSPLLSSTWNQACYGYNDSCPNDPSGPCYHPYAGCVAVAMAQVMNYYEHPVTGEGSYSYNHGTYGEQYANFGSAVYDWSNMPNYLNNISTQEEKSAVAKLLYHCGVAVSMNYSISGSGSYSYKVERAWKQYFKYSSNLLLTYKNAYTEYNWIKLLKDELDKGRPLYYQGYGTGGHAFNIDGYTDDGYFHLNWGWGGSYNGNFYIHDLTPGAYSFNNSQGAIVGVADRDLYPGIDCSSPVVLTSGVSFYGSTVSSENRANKYGSCNYQSTGKEVVHQITTSHPGRIRASLKNLNDSILDVFILSHCNQDSLLAYGDTSAIADNTEPGTYYIVVDGRYAYEGDYTLTVMAPNENPDLIITDQMISPNIIEAGQTGFISFKVKNIGNADASASKTNIYYSLDQEVDPSDIFIEQIDIDELSMNEEYIVSQNIILPTDAVEGIGCILFTADAENDIIETDEIFNTEFTSFTVPIEGSMLCNSAVLLTSGQWYFDNTELNGANNIEDYTCGMNYSGKEIIHSITAEYNGVAEIQFTEKIPGQVYLFPLSSCNENACSMSYALWNPEDTVMTETMQVFSGITYYFVVDAEAGISGEYGLKVTMPDECPDPKIYWWGDLEVCESSGGVSLNTSWYFNDLHWYKDDVPIPDATSAWFWADESAEYKVRVNDYGCSVFSDSVIISIDPEPSHAEITANGNTTFCEGDFVILELNTGSEYSVQWMKNGLPIEGETDISLIADKSGNFSAEVTNIGCSFISNEIMVTANPVTANIGELARVNSRGLISWFSCNINDNTDLSGNGNSYFYGGWDFPEDRNGKWNHASYFNGQWDYTYTANSFYNPTEFTVSLWFKTSSEEGGRLIGFGDSQTGLSTISDRMIYLDDAGKLYFGVVDGVAKSISTIESFNDNDWHHVSASLSSAGMKLYVDGALKAEDENVTSAANYTGWWRLAYDHIDPAFSNVPSSLYYRGILDEIKIWERELTANEIFYLYNESQYFDASLNDDEFCETASTSLSLDNTETFVVYQLRNDADDSPIGTAVSGNTGTVELPTGYLNETTTLNVHVMNTETACSFELNNTFTVNVYDIPTGLISGDADFCEGDSSEIIVDLTGMSPWNISYTDGINTFNESTSENPFIINAFEEGTYELIALSDANCVASDTDLTGTATVLINDIPIINLGEDLTITTDEDVTLDAGTGFVSYLWSDDSQEQNLTLSGSELGLGSFEYWVLVQDVNTCENSDTILIHVNEAASVIYSNEHSEILIAPNPTSGKFRILNAQNTIIEVFDINGKSIFRSSVLNKDQEILLPSVIAGIYFLHITNEYQSETFKIIIR